MSKHSTTPASSESTLNAAECLVITRATALRSRLFGFDTEIAADFARSMAYEWKRNGMHGVRAACWSVAQVLAEKPGSYALYAEARALAVA